MMKVSSLRVTNFRTLESVDLDFSGAYTAICGANDSGKTNAVRALRALFRDDSPTIRYIYDHDDISFKDDFTKWRKEGTAGRYIEIGAVIEMDRDRDTGLYQSILKQLSIDETPESLTIDVCVRHTLGKPSEIVSVKALGKTYGDIDAQEVLNRIRTARVVLFHNSTQVHPRARFESALAYFQDIPQEDLQKLDKSTKAVNKAFATLARGRQKEIEDLIGRLESKYKVGVSLPPFEPDYLPFNITLGESAFNVNLDDMGSGTKNRTLILLLLLAAKQVSGSEASASKVTPIIMIEEPESFLHPSAQAEFGRVLQDLAAEFNVQVVVTTHSPYMLCVNDSSSNILLQRETHYTKARETIRVTTTGEHWMEPFAQALGLESKVFEPWKKLFLSSSDSVLLVEGELDREYLSILLDDAHGDNKLLFSGDIVPYEGTGSLQNAVLLRLLKNRCRKMFVTFDLDCEGHIEPKLVGLGFKKRTDYAPIGHNSAGRRNIEGLLPDAIKQSVRQSRSDLVDAIESGTPAERKSAKRDLKALFLAEFKKSAKPGTVDFAEFYSLTKMLNKVFAC